MPACDSQTRSREPGRQPRHSPSPGTQPVPFGSQAGAQSTEPPQPGLQLLFLNELIHIFKLKKPKTSSTLASESSDPLGRVTPALEKRPHHTPHEEPVDLGQGGSLVLEPESPPLQALSLPPPRACVT